jgi:hypothetical protein
MLGCWLAAAIAQAADKPAVAPDQPPPYSTASRVSATIEFGLPALAAAIERDVPRRLASFNERVNCVHRRVLGFRVNANCDVRGFVERTGPVTLAGRGTHVVGAVSIYGAVRGQGANRFTRRIHGETEARATVEVEARPRLRRDWSLDLNLTDGFHWSEAPILHVLGRDIPLARYVEPRIRKQLARVRQRAAAAARKLDLRGKATEAWRSAFEPIKLSDKPEVWLQLSPNSAVFAGVHASRKVLSGSLELTGTAETFIGHAPPAATPVPLPPLTADVEAPGTFEVVLPLRVDYDTLRQKVKDLLAAAPTADVAVRDVQIYPSSGKLVVGLRVAKSSGSDPNAGEWVYISGAPSVDADAKTVRLSDLAASDTIEHIAAVLGDEGLLARLRQNLSVSYRDGYQRLLDDASRGLTRPLKDGFRMQGHLTSASVDKISLLADGIGIALRARGELKILYGL